MSDIDTLEREIIAGVDGAGDEGALEAVRVAALGKKGSVSELLKTLGSMAPTSARRAAPRSTRSRPASKAPSRRAATC